jgi:hypothetical protein
MATQRSRRRPPARKRQTLHKPKGYFHDRVERAEGRQGEQPGCQRLPLPRCEEVHEDEGREQLDGRGRADERPGGLHIEPRFYLGLGWALGGILIMVRARRRGDGGGPNKW